VDEAPNCESEVSAHPKPPEPMSLTLAAVPSNLAVSRRRLRDWLAEAGVDPQSCADVLLAVGEATANATEHSVQGVGHEVQLTVNAALIGNTLQLTVSDDGAWKPATVSQNHRGHGIHLMNALVDSVELSATPGGTTVAMLKELR
jgi:anti-sigma regulatory factor (Ser/Thr protein kinase)